MTKDTLQVAIVHGGLETRNKLHAAVLQLGHTVSIHALNGAEFVEQAQLHRPDLVIVQEFLSDGTGLEAVERIAAEKPLPTIVIIDQHNGQMLGESGSSHVLAVIQEPVRSSDLIPIVPLAMQQFQDIQALRDRVNQLTRSLDQEEAWEKPNLPDEK